MRILLIEDDEDLSHGITYHLAKAGYEIDSCLDGEDGNIDNYIYFLRRRLHSVGSQLQIKTLRGIGYKLEASDAQ